MLRTILHVQVGSENWEPTQDELISINDMFSNVQKTEINNVGLIVTRFDISAKIISIDSDQNIEVVTAKIDKVD